MDYSLRPLTPFCLLFDRFFFLYITLIPTMIRKYASHSILRRPSRRIRLLALVLFFVAAIWSFTIKSSSPYSRKENIERDFPLTYRYVHSFNGRGGGKSDIPRSCAVRNAHNANLGIKHGTSLQIGLMHTVNNRKTW